MGTTDRLLTTIIAACSNCIKYGAGCPGYDRSHKFVAGKHTVRPRGQNQRGRVETQLDYSSAPATGLNLSTREVASKPRGLAWQAFGPATGNAESHALQSASTIPGSLQEPALPFIYNMIGELFVFHLRGDVIYSAPWFSSLLNHIGRSPVLDTAMCAFMLQLVGTSKSDQGEISRSRDLYGRSLRGLQMALNHPVAWRSTETLAATMFCCQFEVCVLAWDISVF